MSLEIEKIRFEGKAITAAMRLGGSLEDKEATSFLELLFAEWKALELPLVSAESWLAERLAGVFKFVGAPPGLD